MKFSCQKSDIISALSVAIKAVPSNPQVPILGGFFLKATKLEENDAGEIEIWATNNELYIIAKSPAKVEETGHITVTAKYFYDFIRNFPGPDVSLEEEKERNTIRLTSGKINCELLKIAGDFPEPRLNTPSASFTVKSSLLKGLINESVFAASEDIDQTGKPIFTGTLFDVADSRINLVATNTHRLSIASSVIEDNGAKGKAVVPARTLLDIGRTLGDDDIPVTIDICPERAVFHFSDYLISTSVIEGIFPEYQRVIPKNLPITVKVKRNIFYQSINRAVIIASTTSGSPVIKLNILENKVNLTASSQTVGYYDDSFDAEVEGGEITIAFNPNYLLDALKVMQGEEAVLKLAAPLKPGLILDPKNDRFQCVITPVRTKG